MTADDREAFAGHMTVLAEVFREEFSALRLEAYFLALQEHAIEQIAAAMTVMIKTAKFFPKPAEILDAIDGTIEDRAVAAFEQALTACKRLDPSTENLDETARHAVMLMGGLGEIDALLYVGATSVQRAVTRKHFLECYRVAAKRLDTRYALPPSWPKELTP